MAKIGLLRCAQNDQKCPLTGCITCIMNKKQGFAGYDETEFVGAFTIDPSDETTISLARILKAKGADVIHSVTCAFARKKDNTWHTGAGFCENIDALLQRIAQEVDITCVKGAAHLPEGYTPQVFTRECVGK